ncbi:hypothetical protein N9S27_03205 [Alphaproteobacteria bacterium]|nr:hypothetical protein [Alphaproteobacteria bacterium]
MIDQEKLCYSLIHADSRAAVVEELKKLGLWDDLGNWRPLGDNSNNMAVVSNQQDDAFGAFTELLINSSDAVLTRKCKEANIDPEDWSKAPNSINEAVEKFFGFSPRKLDEVKNTERGALAEQLIGVVATGQRKGRNPCYTVYDAGEGQRPSDFEDTFLSINKSNKSSIPFVQGKYCQGSHGSLVFCADYLKLIVSKSFRDDGKPDGEWGFTVIRRRDPQENMRRSVIEYLVINQKIGSFKSAVLNALPGKYPNAYEKPMTSGSLVKLYEYEITNQTSVTLDFLRKINSHIVSAVLPIRFFERRKFGSGTHTFESTLLGLENQLKGKRTENNIEDGFPIATSMDTSFGHLPVIFYALKSGVEKGHYQRSNGIFLLVNGQSHSILPSYTWENKGFSLRSLKDSLICIVDCSGISAKAHEDMFKASRDRTNKKAEKEILSGLQAITENNQKIQDLKNQRRREEMDKKLSNNKHSEDIMKKVLKSSPTLRKILIDGGRISSPFDERPIAKDVFLGKEYPSYFDLDKEYSADSPKLSELGRRCKIQFKTDVEDNYTNPSRDYPGKFIIECEALSPLKMTTNTFNGIWTSNIEIPECIGVGTLLKFKYSLGDETMVEPFSGEFFLETVAHSGNGKPSKPGKRRKNNDSDDGDSSKNNFVTPPVAIPVYRDEWAKYSMDENTALKALHHEGATYDYYFNADNKFLKMHQKTSRSEPKILEQQFAIALHYQALTYVVSQKDEDPAKISKTIEEYSAGSAASILDVMNSLSNLEVE